MKEEILIVGAGPVGLSAAMALVKKGVPVTVIESEKMLTNVPKASTLHPPTLEVFNEWGILQKVEEQSLVVRNFQYWNRGKKEVISDLKLGLLKDDTKYPYRYQCEQHILTQILYDELVDSDLARIYLNTKLVDLDQDKNKVVVQLETDGVDKRATFDYVIGADGASSIVRKKLGIEFEGITYPQYHLLVCVENHDFTEEYPNLAPVSYFFDHVEWVALIQNPNYWKFLLPLDTTLKNQITDEYIQTKIRQFAGQDKEFDIFHWVVYKVHQRVADKFLEGRCVIIGDAAHVNNPLGGMGMNSGIHDAYFLANYMAQIYHSGEPKEILKDFEEKRQRNAKEVVQKITIRNEEAARQTDTMKESIRKMEILNKDDVAARTYLLESSMINGFHYAYR